MKSRRGAIATMTLALASALARGPAEDPPKPRADEPASPFLAIWRQSEGRVPPPPPGAPDPSRAPYLRVAIWDDGRILFAKDPTKWSHDLREGRLSADRVSRLKKAIEETGV